MTSIEVLQDPLLLRPVFKTLDTTWRNWIMALKAMDGLPMTEEEIPLFRQCTHRQTPPTAPAQEVWLVIGRRGGKSFIVAFKAVHLACFRDYRPFLGPGEIGVVMIIATDRKQARVIHRYITAILNSVPMLAAMIVRKDSESIDLDNGISIEITTASYRTIRGYTVVAALCDEIAFWRSDDSANPAEEILSALRPAMSTIPGAMLIALGTPYRRSGPLYDTYRKHFGQDSPVLVIQADTRTMNPTVPQSVIDRAMELDPQAAGAEYGALFRSDVGSFLDLDLIERAIEPGRRERAWRARYSYLVFGDPAGGGGSDWFTWCLGHCEGERIVLDAIRGVRPPFDPSVVVKECATLCKQYRCASIVGDRYAGEWVVEAFAKHGLHYKHSDLTKSELYLESMPLFAQGCVDLLDHPLLLRELGQLERRTHRSGRDSVDHPPGGHDDHANACCGVLALLASRVNQEAVMVPILGA